MDQVFAGLFPEMGHHMTTQHWDRGSRSDGQCWAVMDSRLIFRTGQSIHHQIQDYWSKKRIKAVTLYRYSMKTKMGGQTQNPSHRQHVLNNQQERLLCSKRTSVRQIDGLA